MAVAAGGLVSAANARTVDLECQLYLEDTSWQLGWTSKTVRGHDATEHYRITTGDTTSVVDDKGNDLCTTEVRDPFTKRYGVLYQCAVTYNSIRLNASVETPADGGGRKSIDLTIAFDRYDASIFESHMVM
ncbi:MAG: hypothetical protein JF615_07340, partial [Asticcacaulis sp.]|nr:hypothetical protein [Asticcacaulis sp.]